MRTKHCLADHGHMKGNSTIDLTGAGPTNGPTDHGADRALLFSTIDLLGRGAVFGLA